MMRVSMWMIYDAVAEDCAEHNLGELSQKICLKGLLPFLGPEQLSEEYLYMLDGTSLDTWEPPEGCRYVAVVGETVIRADRSRCQYVRFRSGVTMGQALLLSLKAFEIYRDWHDRLQSVLIRGADLNGLCRIGRELLDNDVMLYDREYTVIAGDYEINGELTGIFVDLKGPYVALSSSALKQLKNNADFQQTFRQSRAAVCTVDFLPYSVLYVNLGSSHTYEGRLCVNELIRPFRNGDYQLAEILTEVLRLGMGRLTVRSGDDSRKFESFLRQLLDGGRFGDEELDAFLRLWHWKRHGRFVVVKVEINELDAQTASDVFIIAKIMRALPGACALRYKDGVAVVLSLSDSQEPDTVAETLGGFIKGLVQYIGVSSVFEHIRETAQYYLQAAIAAELGAQEAPKLWSHHFKEHAMTHYFRHGTALLPAIHYCDSDVRQLMHYRHTRTDYYTTLKVYLENNMNLLETAKSLYIHRTTLFNRVSKLRELLQADLDNPEDRVRLLVSFKLMEADEAFRKA